jgi:DNA/RNA endonuclease YhcR with UshA esterase domain
LEGKEEIPLNAILSRCLLAIAVASLVLSASSSAQQKENSNPGDAGNGVTIEGAVRDMSCVMQNKNASATKFSLKRTTECAKQGSPLIIFTKDGVIYTPISGSTPDTDQRQRLMPFVGKYVKATGQVFEKNGTHAIAIREITEMKEVHLDTD